MRGDKEAVCFDKIKHALFYKDGMPICNPFDECSAFTTSDSSFAMDYTSYCNLDFVKNYFGLLESECLEFAISFVLQSLTLQTVNSRILYLITDL